MAIEIPHVSFDEFAVRYCERQEQTPDGLKAILLKQIDQFHPDGWMLLECAMLDSSRLGDLTILPFGPRCTHKSVPSHPISPRGLASDMSTVVAILPAKELQDAGPK